jgi:hypothetical protein
MGGVMNGKCFLLLLLVFISVPASAQESAGGQRTNARPPETLSLKVCVLGDVAKPSELLFKKGLTVTRAIEEAGGIVGERKGKEVKVFSGMWDDHDMRVIYIDLKAIEKHPYKDLELQSFDLVEVYSPKKRKMAAQPLPNPCPSVIPESLWRGFSPIMGADAHNNGMHPTADTTALM